MQNLFYIESKIQDYLKSNKFSTSEAKMVFSWRTRMANFNENYRGSNGHTPCPLCHFHLDSQVMAFQCQELTANVNISGKHADIFNEGIPLMLVQSITKMMKYRETFLQERKLMNQRDAIKFKLLSRFGKCLLQATGAHLVSPVLPCSCCRFLYYYVLHLLHFVLLSERDEIYITRSDFRIFKILKIFEFVFQVFRIIFNNSP